MGHPGAKGRSDAQADGGGPARATFFYTMYLWDNAFSYLRMGYACAMAWILFLAILALNAALNRLSSSRVHYTGD